MKTNIILNRDLNYNIGIHDSIIYHIKEDMKWFRNITESHFVIMGYNTWKSLDKKLKKRFNIVITRNHYKELSEKINNQLEENVPDKVYESYEECIRELTENSCEEVSLLQNRFNYLSISPEIFIIGGGQLYQYVMDNFTVDVIYETQCHNKDEFWTKELNSTLIKYQYTINPNIYQKTFFKECNHKASIYTDFKENRPIYKEYPLKYSFHIYRKISDINYGEMQYLSLLSDVFHGEERETRNSKVKSIFGGKITFDLREGFPLLTSKRMGWKTILRELLWFISGSTDNKHLQEKNVHIWDGNSSNEYMKKRGLNYEEGDLGPIYGFQWRHFGEKYETKDKEYDGGYDQLKEMIHLIKSDPTSRRIIMSSWNPPDLDKMALPPCHILFQVYIDGKYIDGQLYQRSGDMFLGVPFNIASYSFLLHILGNITGYIPRYLHQILGDCHIYSNHYLEVETQLKRSTYPFPKLLISEKIKNIDKISEEIFTIHDYQSNSSIKAEMIA